MSQYVSIYPSRLRKHFYQPKPNLNLTGRKMATRSDVFPKDPLPVTGASNYFAQEFRMEFKGRTGTWGQSWQPSLVCHMKQ